MHRQNMASQTTTSRISEESNNDYDLDVPRYRGGKNDNAEMFDHSMEDDKNEENQNKKDSSTTNEDESARKDREGTPGPQSEAEKEHMKHGSASQGPGTSIKGVADDPNSTK